MPDSEGKKPVPITVPGINIAAEINKFEHLVEHLSYPSIHTVITHDEVTFTMKYLSSSWSYVSRVQTFVP